MAGRPSRSKGGRAVPVITVDGPIAADELGPTLSHEHVFIDTSPDYREPPPAHREPDRRSGRRPRSADHPQEPGLPSAGAAVVRLEPDRRELRRRGRGARLGQARRHQVDLRPHADHGRPATGRAATAQPRARDAHRHRDRLLPRGVPAARRRGAERRRARERVPDRGHGRDRRHRCPGRPARRARHDRRRDPSRRGTGADRRRRGSSGDRRAGDGPHGRPAPRGPRRRSSS